METGDAPPPVSLFRDEPTDLGDENDDFGHASYANVLVESLKRAHQPLTIGLLGPWGVGKSSVLQRTLKDLGAVGNGVVLFDAWRYDGFALRRQFVREIAYAVRDQKVLDNKAFNIKKRLARLEVDQQVGTVRTKVTLGAAGVAALQTLVLVISAFVLLRIPAIREIFAKLESKNGTLLSLGLTAITYVTTFVGQLFRTVPYTETQRRIEDPEIFHDLFKDLVAATTAPRLIVAVDNLDRCPAPDALELLATIKTYLEPAAKKAQKRRGSQSDTEVLFVIAVDDDGLRRHLDREGDLGGDADEYLRKIFTATIRFAPLLSDDLREYVAGKVAEIRTSLALTGDQERALTGLIDSAFRDSPRQILQFLNTLQLRLRLVRERERGNDPQISGRISSSPLLIAKLALIEDRWPDHYRLLKERPHSLDEWHLEARDPRFDTHGLLDEWRRLRPFLLLSDDIRAPDLRPYIGLKRSEEEIGLPEYEVFRAAAVGADRDVVREVLNGHAELADRYAARAHKLFNVELSVGNLEAARAVLDVILTEPRLQDATTTPLLERAVRHPEFGDQLRLLPAAPLLDVAPKLAADGRDKAVRNIVGRLSDGAPDRSFEAAVALAGGIGTLLPTELDAIRDATLNAPLSERYGELGVLVAADQQLLTVVVVDGLQVRLRQSPELLIDAQRGAGARAIVRAAARSEELKGATSGLFEALDAAVGHFRDTNQFAGLLELVDLLRDIAGGPLSTRPLQAALRAALPVLPEAKRETALGVLWDLATQPGSEDELGGLAQFMVDDGDLAITADWNDLLSPLPEDGRNKVFEAIISRIGEDGPVGRSREFVDLIDRYAPHPGRALGDVARRWIGQGAERVHVTAIVDRAGRIPNETKAAVAAAATDRAAGTKDKADALGWLVMAVRLADVSPRLHEVANDVLSGVFAHADDKQPDVATLSEAVTLVRSLGSTKAQLSKLVEPVLRNLLSTERLAGVLESLIPVQEDLNTNQRDTLRVGALGRWATNPGDRPSWRRRLMQLNGFVSDGERAMFDRTVLTEVRRAASRQDQLSILEIARDIGDPSILLVLFLIELASSERKEDQLLSRALPRTDGWAKLLDRVDAGVPAQERKILLRLSQSPATDQEIAAEWGKMPGAITEFDRLRAGEFVALDGDHRNALTASGRRLLRAIDASGGN